MHLLHPANFKAIGHPLFFTASKLQKGDVRSGHSHQPGYTIFKDSRSLFALNVYKGWMNGHAKFCGGARRGFPAFYEKPPVGGGDIRPRRCVWGKVSTVWIFLFYLFCWLTHWLQGDGSTLAMGGEAMQTGLQNTIPKHSTFIIDRTFHYIVCILLSW